MGAAFTTAWKPVYELGTGLAIHILILFTILTFFFYLYCQFLESSALNNQFTDIIDSGVRSGLASLSAADQSNIKSSITDSQDFLRVLYNINNTTDQVRQKNNNWLFFDTFSFIVLIVLFLVFWAVNIGVDHGWAEIGRVWAGAWFENIVTFAFVGSIEVMFFLKIGKNFIPTKPSLIYQSLVTDLQNEFSAGGRN